MMTAVYAKLVGVEKVVICVNVKSLAMSMENVMHLESVNVT